MRRYELADGTVLVETGLASAMYLTLDGEGRFVVDDGTAIEPRTFEQRDASEQRIATYGQPHTYALDDYFYILDLYWVADGALVRGMIEMGGAGGAFRTRIAINERVLAL